MSDLNKHKENKPTTFEVLGQLLSDKKEVKQRVKSGENLRLVTQEKGLKIVFPL